MVGWSRAAVHDHDNADPGAAGTIPKIVFLLPYALLERPDPRSASSSCAQARQLVRVVALLCTREHLKINFRQKKHMICKTVFHVFAGRSPMPYFYNELSPSRRHSFRHFCLKLAISISGPRTTARSQKRPSDNPPTRPRGAPALYIQTPDQPPLAAVMYIIKNPH